MTEETDEQKERAQLREFKMTTMTPGWIHYENMLYVQREAVIKNLKEKNKDSATTRDVTQAIIGELSGIDMARDIARRLLARFDEEQKNDFEKETEKNDG